MPEEQKELLLRWNGSEWVPVTDLNRIEVVQKVDLNNMPFGFFPLFGFNHIEIDFFNFFNVTYVNLEV